MADAVTTRNEQRPQVAAIVVTYDQRDLLHECLVSIEVATRGEPSCQVIVVDNGSTDGSADMVRREHPAATLIELEANEGFAGGARRGIDGSDSDWVALVNNDATIDPGAMDHMLKAGKSDPRIGSVAPLICFQSRPDLVNSAGLEIDRLGIPYDRLAGVPRSMASGHRVEVFGATGCVALLRRDMLDHVGGLDQSFFAYLEDADLAWRAQMLGWRAVYEPRAIAYHRGSATITERSTRKYFLVGRNRMRMLAKNADRGQLIRYGAAIALYELAYVAFVAATDRTVAPLRGRLSGAREWGRYRRLGAGHRRPVELARATGWLGALRQRAAYAKALARP